MPDPTPWMHWHCAKCQRMILPQDEHSYRLAPISIRDKDGEEQEVDAMLCLGCFEIWRAHREGLTAAEVFLDRIMFNLFDKDKGESDG